MNQELFVCMCAPVCNLFRAPRNRCAYFCVREIVCMCVIDVLVMRGLNAAKSSNCERNAALGILFSLIAVCHLSNSLFFFLLHFVLLNFSYLSRDKWGDYLLTCIRFYRLV